MATNNKSPPTISWQALEIFVVLGERGSGDPAVVIPFNGFRSGGQERLGLRISDHFRQAVVDGPDRAANLTFENSFTEPLGMKVKLLVFMIVANGALHDNLLC
jgi:hypothetical protein